MCKHIYVYVFVSVNVHIVSFNEYLMCLYYGLGFILSAKDTVLTRQSLCLEHVTFQQADTHSKLAPRRKLNWVRDRMTGWDWGNNLSKGRQGGLLKV